MQGDRLHYQSEYGERHYDEENDIKTTTLAEIYDPNACYSFDTFWIFKHDESGRIFYGSDSGCSCPSPFENEHFNSPDDTSFQEVTKINFETFCHELWAHCGDDARLTDEKHAAERIVKEALGVR